MIVHLLNEDKYPNDTRLHFSKILLFLCKSFMSFSKSIAKARSTAKTHKSLNRLSDIVLCVVVLINFILLNVLSQVLVEIGTVIDVQMGLSIEL